MIFTLFPFWETFAYRQVMKIFSNVFFENFIVSAFMFSSVIHLKLILVHDVKYDESGLIYFPDGFLFHCQKDFSFFIELLCYFKTIL